MGTPSANFPTSGQKSLMIALGLVSAWVLPYVKYGVTALLRGLLPIDQGLDAWR